MEFVAAVNLVLRGKLTDKLKWSFKVYDRDGNGCLDKQEVRHIIRVRSKKKIFKVDMHNNNVHTTTDNVVIPDHPQDQDTWRPRHQGKSGGHLRQDL